MDDFNLVREAAAKLLSEKKVDKVLGFKKGSIALKAQPAFITTVRDTKKLILDGFCQNNLAVFLHEIPKDERVAFICRGCESRAVRALAIEHQVKRENLYLIGVPCTGILDWKKIRQTVNSPISSAVDDGKVITIKSEGNKKTFERSQFIVDSCRACTSFEPVGVDEQIGQAQPLDLGGEKVQPTWAETFAEKSPDERFQLFTEETDRCIRCYACREACPMCYCTECFVDHIMPRWSESMVTPSGTQAWHLIRAFHQTGRCVECGACERACPMNIKMTYMTDKLNADMKEKYGFEVGADEKKQPPFASITLDDKNRFIK